MTLVLVMILAVLFSVLSVAVLVGHRPGGRVGDARICRLAMRPPIVDRAEGRRKFRGTAASIPLAVRSHFPLPRRGGPFVSPGFGTRHDTAAAERWLR
jgi:hypothetical protein